MNLFFTNMQLFTSQDVNWRTGVVWITCVLLWCFISCLDSFWRHPFTAEDPLMSKWCNATFLQICSVEETNSSISYMAWEWVHFLQMFIIGWTISRAKYKIICYVTKKDPRIFEKWLLIVRLINILCAILIAADWSYPFFSCFFQLLLI